MASPIHDVLREFRQLAKDWQTDVAHMRKMSKNNPGADVLEFAARDLLQRVHLVEATVKRLSPDQYAKLHATSAQTVRRWCQRRELPARQNALGEWEIEADAVRRPRVRKSA